MPSPDLGRFDRLLGRGKRYVQGGHPKGAAGIDWRGMRGLARTRTAPGSIRTGLPASDLTIWESVG